MAKDEGRKQPEVNAEYIDPESEKAKKEASQAIALTRGAGIDKVRTSEDRILREEEFRQAILLKQAVIGMALSVTSKNDWIDENGEPYLVKSGVEKMLVPFQLSLGRPEYLKEVIEGRHGKECLITALVQVTNESGLTFTGTGTASTGDDFFAKKHELDPKTGKWLKDGDHYIYRWLRMEEVDLQDVIKKAYTNAVNRAVKAILGINGLSWDDLARYGIKPAERKVSYSGGKSGSPAASPKKDEPAATPDAETPKDDEVIRLRDEIREMLIQSTGGDATKARALLQGLTHDKPKFGGYFSTDKINAQYVKKYHSRVKAFTGFLNEGVEINDAVEKARKEVA